MTVKEAWNEWWGRLGHVGRCNRDPARTREAFEAGYLAALASQSGNSDGRGNTQTATIIDSVDSGIDLKKKK